MIGAATLKKRLLADNYVFIICASVWSAALAVPAGTSSHQPNPEGDMNRQTTRSASAARAALTLRAATFGALPGASVS
ncbi:MAG: hypothetical protein KGK09_13605 [Burkholderiales bacterium]|nr:hypothetical protein [Burkholderiales bacterium]